MSLPISVSPDIAIRIGWTLVHSLWEGALIAVFAAMLLRLARSSSAQARYAIACSMMAMLPITVAETYLILPGERPADRPANIASPGIGEPVRFFASHGTY